MSHDEKESGFISHLAEWETPQDRDISYPQYKIYRCLCSLCHINSIRSY